MSAIDERQKIITDILKPAFKKAGFKKIGNNFIREEVGFTKVFRFENSSWNAKDRVDFSLFVGIFFPIVEQVRNRPIHKFPGTHFEINTNQLTNSKRFLRIIPDTDIEELRSYVSGLIENYVLPFFSCYSDIKDCIDLPKKYFSAKYDIRPFIGLVLLEQGYIDAGKKLMETLNQSTYIESFRKQLLDYGDFLISKHR
jgi:hypothetical protein